MIQNIIVFLIVAAAAVYLGRLLWISLSGKKGCGSCATGGCSKAMTTPQQSGGNLIQISLNGKSGPSNDGKSTPTAKPPKPSGTSSDQ